MTCDTGWLGLDRRRLGGTLRPSPATQPDNDVLPLEEKPDTAGVASGGEQVVGTIIMSGGEDGWKAGNKRGEGNGPLVPAAPMPLPGILTTEMSWVEPAGEWQLFVGEVVLVVDRGAETSGTV